MTFLKKRFNYIKEYIIKDADKKAEEQLFLVENEIERKFGKFVLPLVNMNLCHAMQNVLFYINKCTLDFCK